jgi:hypothetical protein
VNPENPMTGIHRLFRRFAPCLLLLALLGAGGNGAEAAPGVKGPRLDTATVRRLYLDGEFDPAIALLEETLKTKAGFTHDDSVFIFKHLGVMYAAKYETREKGKHYMHRLLEAEPTARIMDMYASDMIYMIFKNIQDEFEASRRRFERAETQLGAAGRPEPKPAPAAAKPQPARDGKRQGSSAMLWMGAAAVATAGAVAWFYYSDDEPGTRTVVDNHQPD